jgi:hypothetical protein
VSLNRFFFRCPRCLFKFTADVDSYKRPDVEACPVCAREYVECLGATKGVVSWATPCNDVCTYAEGPTCSCSCGGKNHGSRLVIPVVRNVVDFKSGRFPTLEKARVEWERWRAKVEAAKGAAVGPAALVVRDAVREAAYSKSWPNRQKLLARACEGLGVALSGVALASAPLVGPDWVAGVVVGPQLELCLC